MAQEFWNKVSAKLSPNQIPWGQAQADRFYKLMNAGRLSGESAPELDYRLGEKSIAGVKVGLLFSEYLFRS